MSFGGKFCSSLLVIVFGYSTMTIANSNTPRLTRSAPLSPRLNSASFRRHRHRLLHSSRWPRCFRHGHYLWRDAHPAHGPRQERQTRRCCSGFRQTRNTSVTRSLFRRHHRPLRQPHRQGRFHSRRKRVPPLHNMPPILFTAAKLVLIAESGRPRPLKTLRDSPSLHLCQP